MTACLPKMLNCLLAASLVCVAGPSFATDSGTAPDPEFSLDRTTISRLSPRAKSVWIQRSYPTEISLGVDVETGVPIYPHRSVRIQYVVDCSRYSLNMVAWKLYSEAGAHGQVVWADQIEGPDADYRYTPLSREEHVVVGELCNTGVADR